MNMDALDICPCGQSDACYTQQVNENIKNKQCYGCGFLSNSLMKEGEPFYEQQFELLPELYKDLIWEDNDGYKWMPTTVNIHDKGLVFAYGSNPQEWKWGAVKAVLIEENERSKYPNPISPGEFYTHKTDMTTMKLFDKHDFIEALDYIDALNK
jgi:hypothetical protein